MNIKQVIAVNCERPRETEEKKYHHNTAIAAVFDSVYNHLYFIAKTPQAEAKAPSMLIYMLNKNTYSAKKGEANQKQQLSDYTCD